MPETVKNVIEFRAISGFELRVDDDGKRYIEGYAIKWEQLSEPLGYFYKFREKFQKGAFDDYLKSGADTKFLVDHEPGKVLGRSKKSTLTLKSDDTGLKYSVKIPQTTVGNDAHEDVRSGNKEYISIGFKRLEELWDETDENNRIRTIIKANLPEISLTAWPAYEQSTASARSMDDAYKDYRAANPKPEPVPEADPKLVEQKRYFHRLRTKIYQAYEEEK